MGDETALTVVCDCAECVNALCDGHEYTFRDFVARKRWADSVHVKGRVNCQRVFASAENRGCTHQVAIEQGGDTAWLCKHGIAALELLGKRRVQVLWERDQAERIWDSLVRAGEKPRLFIVNGRVSVVAW